MDKKQTGIAYFMRDARRIGDLKEFRLECIRKQKGKRAYVIEKMIQLSSIDYENFCTDLLVGRKFISDNIKFMFSDSNGIWHCLLVVQFGRMDMGILVESKKSDYPMYSALYRKTFQNLD